MPFCKKIVSWSAILPFVFLGITNAADLKPKPADKSKAPYKFAGKLFFVQSDRKLGEICSAQYVGSNDVILTAAHCVVNKNGRDHPANRFVFLHAYDAKKPIEVNKPAQVAKCKAVPTAFKGDTKINYDFAFLKMSGPGNQGHFKLSTGLKDGDAVTSIGYPPNFEDGKELMAVHGNRKSHSTEHYKNIQIFEGNPFGQGSSGGAWVNSSKEVVGLNVKTWGDNESMISPILDGTFKKLFDFVNGGCKGTNP